MTLYRRFISRIISAWGLRCRPERITDQVYVGYANSFHDPAIAIAWKQSIYAECLERSYQIKRALWNPGLFYNVPQISYNLRRLNIPVGTRVDICLNTSWKPSIRFYLIPYVLRSISWVERIFNVSSAQETGTSDGISVLQILALSQALFVKTLPIFRHHIRHDLWKGRAASIKTKAIDHHLCHAANAVYTSIFDECVVMTIDGSGETQSTSLYRFHNNDFELLNSSPNYYSLGLLYASVTKLCGFSPAHGEEWKLMGLAAYGKHSSRLYAFFRELVKVDGLTIKFTSNIFQSRSFEKPLLEIEGVFREECDPDILKSADLAHNFQQAFTDTIIDLCANVYSLGLSENLAYAGGCALNSSTNGLILERTNFKQLHIPSAPGDDGNALGALLYQRHKVDRIARDYKLMTPYLGSDLDLERIEHILDFGKFSVEKYDDDNALTGLVAGHLADGAIVGWMQGRAEFGPRALGNRSILADPRRADMRERINSKVKFREGFRPFAPSILHHRGEELFAEYQFSPYMERTLRVRPGIAERVPAVVHVNGTSRVHSVTSESNPLFFNLLSKFDAVAGVPVLLNTSLNVMGRPIASSAVDAITILFTSALNILVIGPYIISHDRL